MTVAPNPDRPFRVAVIGVGQIGFRHLQSLLKIDLPVSLEAVDPDPDRLREVKRLLEEQEPEGCKPLPVAYRNRIRDLSPALDAVIIATNSDIRASLAREILGGKEIRNIIFEKVVFQSVREFEEIGGIIEGRNVGAWVNCPRRMYPVYNEIRQLFSGEEKITCMVQGGDWGLASNAVHFLDLLAYLNPGCRDAKLETFALEKTVYPSKRKSFIELAGTLHGAYSRGSMLILQAHKDVSAPHLITILGSGAHVVVDEVRGEYRVARKDNQWKWQDVQYARPLQSEMTHLAVKDILEHGRCGLTGFQESLRYHRPLLGAVCRHLKAVTGHEPDRCPIT